MKKLNLPAKDDGWVAFEGDNTKTCSYFIDFSGNLVDCKDDAELELLVVKSMDDYTLPLSHNYRNPKIRDNSILEDGLIVDFSDLLDGDNPPQRRVLLKSDDMGIGLNEPFKVFYPLSNGVVYCEWSSESELMKQKHSFDYCNTYSALVGNLTRDPTAVHAAYSIDSTPLMYVLIFNPPVNDGDIVKKVEFAKSFGIHYVGGRISAELDYFQKNQPDRILQRANLN